MSQTLKKRNRYRIRKVQRTHGPERWNRRTVARMCANKLLGKTRTFLSKHQRITSAIRSAEITAVRKRGEKMKFPRWGFSPKRAHEVRKIYVPPYIDQVPIVNTRSAYGMLIDPKTQRPHQVKW